MCKKQVRTLLKANPDGMTASELSDSLAVRRQYVVTALTAMADVYIDRWIKYPGNTRKYWPIYVAVEVPANTPKPD